MSNPTNEAKIVVARVLDDATGRYNDVSVELEGATPTTVDDDVMVVHAEAVPLVAEHASADVCEGATVAAPIELPPGGEWGRLRYPGPVTQAICCATLCVVGIPGVLVFCILDPACDEQDAYKVGDQFYSAEGNRLNVRRSRDRFMRSSVHTEMMER